ncbi:MAG: hypothetical protein AAFQ66_19485 [Pseudomonadota bacterium]
MVPQVAPLPEVHWLEGTFVRADLDVVLARFRGEMATVIARQNVQQHEATGENAGIQKPLGQETFPHMHPPHRRKAEQGFSVHGFARVSVPICNPDWVFVEPPFGLGTGHFFLHEWCHKAPVLHVWSGLFSYELDAAHDKDAMETHGFCYEAEGRQMRWLEWRRSVDEGTRLIKRRKPLPFENTAHYTAKRTKDRMNRRVLFELLGNLEIDALSVFGNRALKDPHLYTIEPLGETCAGYVEDRARYESLYS